MENLRRFKMNKKGADSIFSLFGATILIVLILAFFSIFALLLLFAVNKPGVSFAAIDSSLNLNMISFLQRNDTSELKNWQVISLGNYASLKEKSKEFIQNPMHELQRKSVYMIVLDKDEQVSYPEKFFNEERKAFLEKILVDNGAGYHSRYLCDKGKLNSGVSEIYIPKLNNNPKKLVVCIK